jgi:hypothetical protein
MGIYRSPKLATHLILLRCGVSLRGANDFRELDLASGATAQAEQIAKQIFFVAFRAVPSTDARYKPPMSNVWEDLKAHG